MSEAACVCACDLGTTGIKVALYSETGRLLAAASRERSLRFPAPGQVEQPNDEGYRLQLAAMREAVQRAGVHPAAVRAIALSCQRGTVVPLAPGATPLQDAVVWMDRRGMAICQELKESPGLERWYDACGSPLVPFTGISKILWFQRHRPDLFERARFVPNQTAHALWLGAEEWACDASSASFFAAYDLAGGGWHQPLLTELGLRPEHLPAMRRSTDVVGGLSAAAAEAAGLAPGTPIVIGGGDGQCAGLGSGCTSTGQVMVNLGTAAGVQTFLPAPRLDPGRNLNCGAHVISGAWEMEGHTQASGVALKWLRDTIGQAEIAAAGSPEGAYALLDAVAAAAPPGCRGLVFLPTMNGSSAPLDRPQARGAWIGLGLEHDRACLVRSVLEGVCLEVRWILTAMQAAGVSVEAIRIVGGGARSPLWCQMHADILGKPVLDPGVSDATLAGVAVCAGVAAGLYGDFAGGAELFQQGARTYLPDPAHAAVYDEQFALYRRSYEALYR